MSTKKQFPIRLRSALIIKNKQKVSTYVKNKLK